MKYWLIKLTLIIGEYEKMSTCIREALTEDEAVKSALEGECHGTPDFREFPDFDACWDMGEMVYKVYDVREVTETIFGVLHKLGI